MGKVLGKSFQDRQRSARVRNLALDQIEEVLTKGTLRGKKASKTFHEDLLLKLSGNVLPRLNVVSGDEDSPLEAHVTVEFVNPR